MKVMAATMKGKDGKAVGTDELPYKAQSTEEPHVHGSSAQVVEWLLLCGKDSHQME